MKTVALVMGRGYEGCGVSAFTIEQYKWYIKHGWNVRVLVVNDYKWQMRNTSHDQHMFEFFKIASTTGLEAFQKALDASDLVIINSIPSTQHKPLCVQNFYGSIEAYAGKVVLVQHDHSIIAIKRNVGMLRAIDRANLIFAHSTSSDFANYVIEHTTPTAFDLLTSQDFAQKKIFPFQPGLDFDSVRSLYWKPVECHDVMAHRWIGRNTSWKGIGQMINFHSSHLRKFGAITIMEGVDRNPAFIDLAKKYEFINSTRIDPKDQIYSPDMLPYAHNIFNKSEMLERMSMSGFGYQLSVLPEKFIDRQIEYTHCEVACSGTIPVFRKNYGLRCTHRKSGNKLFNDKHTGTVWFDDDNLDATFEQIKQLTASNSMRDEYRHMAFEYYKEHQDSEYTFKEMCDIIEQCAQ